MAFNQLILSEKYVREQSIINDNVDFKLLRPVVFMVQDLKLKPLLGKNLYDRVLYETTETGPDQFANLSPEVENLVNNYVLPFLDWSVVAESLITLKFRLMNKGVIEKQNEFSQPSTTDDTKFIEKRYSSYAQSYAQDMIKYIVANKKLFPEYLTNNGIDEDKPQAAAYSSPWYIPDYNFRSPTERKKYYNRFES